MAGALRDERGTALLEFALILPIALLLYLGSIQIADAIACNRKVTRATRAVADLTAQNVSGIVTAAEVDGILAATTQVMAPYATQSAVIRVTEIMTDASLKTTVQWSRALNGGAYAKGSMMTVPVAMRVPDTYFLLAEVRYAYTPVVAKSVVGPLTLRDSLFMIPRNTSKINCNDC